jgi:hypothetical protein
VISSSTCLNQKARIFPFELNRFGSSLTIDTNLLSISALKAQDMVIFESMPGIIDRGFYKFDEQIGTVEKVGNRYHLLTTGIQSHSNLTSPRPMPPNHRTPGHGIVASAILATTTSRSFAT